MSAVAISPTKPESHSAGAGDLVSRFARTGAGRDWLHAFARQRVGRVCVIAQSVLLTLSAVLLAMGIGGAEPERGRGLVVTIAGAVQVLCCALAWHKGLFERRSDECGATVAKYSRLTRILAGVLILAATGVLAVDRAIPQYFGPAFGLVASYPMASAMSLVLHYVVFLVAVTFAAAVFSPLFRTSTVGLLALGVTGVAAGSQVLAGMVARLDLWVASFLIAYLLSMKLRLSNWHENLWNEWETHLDLLAALAASQERLAIARDIHDTTGQTLTAIAVKAEYAQALFEKGDPAAIREAREVSRLARKAMVETRGLATGYRRTSLEEELGSARTLLEASQVSLLLVGDATEFPDGVREVFAWVLREGVTNVVRHAASATAVVVLFETVGGQARMTIRNDGVGGAGGADGAELPDKVRRRTIGAGGSGLPGLSERLAAVRGQLQASRSATTFALIASAPLEHVAPVAKETRK